MIIIGIDPSLTSTGVCTLGNSGDILSTVAITSKFDGPKRLHDIKKQLKPICSRGATPLSQEIMVFIEGYSFGSHNGREALGELGGMIRLMLYEEGMEYVDVAPTSLKKYVTGKGTGDKVAMAIGVIKAWGKDFLTTDQTDAYALAMFGRGYMGLVGDLKAYQKEAIEAIKNPKVKKVAKK